MFERVLVPTDGTDASDRAVEHGLTVADAVGAEVHALYVIDDRAVTDQLSDDDREAMLAAAEEVGRDATDAIVERGADLGVDVTAELRRGVPHETVIAYANEVGADLIAMGTHGRTGPERFVLGSTAERVVRAADAPVLTVRTGARRAADGEPYEDVLVPTDGSDAAEAAAERAVDLAQQWGATVHLLYVVDTSVYRYVDVPRSIVGLLREGGEETTAALTELAEAADVRVTRAVRKGRPSEEILDYADETDADLVVMGTRGRTGLPEVTMGSTTARVVRTADLPVLTVK